MKYIAKLASIVFHPLFIAFYGILVLYSIDPVFSLYTRYMQLYLIAYTFCFTTLFPVCLILIYRIINRIKFDQFNRDQRHYPYLFTTLSLILGGMFFRRLGLNQIYEAMMMASAITILTVFFVNLKWKISAHMAAVGGALGIFAVLAYQGVFVSFEVGVVLVAIIGLVGMSRLFLVKHTPAQVYWGCFLGFIVCGSVLRLYF